MSSSLELRHVSKRFGDTHAVDDAQLEVGAGELLSILGPSGCGKTTTLRLIAGLERPDSGTIRIGDRDVTGVGAESRPVATVFQSYALFPHLDVGRNIAYGFRWRRGIDRRDAAEKVRKVIRLVRLDGLEHRRPSELSGGQRQRVALARAIVLEPEVLLLDEPLAAVDALLRAELRDELRSLQRELAMTFVYVTHDRDEAFVLSDRVAVMSSGRIVQTGSPRELYETPATAMVAELMGTANLLEGELGPDAFVTVGPFRLPVASGDITSGRCLVAIRPEHLDIASPGSAPSPEALVGQVARVSYLGSTTEVTVRLSHGPTIVAMPRAGRATGGTDVAGWQEGDPVTVSIDRGAARVLPVHDPS